MKTAIYHAANRCATGFRDALPVTALGLLALELAIAFPASRSDGEPAQEQDYVLHFQSQQLFQCDLEELSEGSLADLKRWRECMLLTTRHEVAGLQNLTDQECRFVVEVLDSLCPDTETFVGFHRIRESCRRRLYCQRIAADRELHSNDSMRSD